MSKLRTILVGLLLAHSWYPLDCCGDGDCHPVPCADIQPRADGYFYKGELTRGVSFGAGIVKPSPDGLCHICISLDPHGPSRALCAFVPQGNV